MENFRVQIKDDIDLIKEEWNTRDPHLDKDEYAFNYWVLSKIYNLDEETIVGNVIDYNDKGIDCFAHFEESKELFVVQNKYYSQQTPLKRPEVADFLTTPLSHLVNGTYKRSHELQTTFNNAYSDPEYKIWFHLYLSNEQKNNDIEQLFKSFNLRQGDPNAAQIRGQINYLSNIYELYFGESYKEKVKFDFTLNTKNKGTILKILPEEYDLEGMSEAYYIMTPIFEIFQMYKEAKNAEYPIFEENIREYLGKGGVNAGIIKTLKDKNERRNFFYYNNGVTIICDGTTKASGGQYSVTVKQPQIVNGCQTVNTIHEVLSNYSNEELKSEFENSFVMVKVLIFNDDIRQEKPDFYKDIVRYTNKQNSINEKAFGASREVFSNIKDYFEERGFLLEVKPSDKYQNKTKYSDKAKLHQLLTKARNYTENTNIELKTVADISIPLDKLLQLYVSFLQDGYVAFNKKNQLLKPSSELFKLYSTKIQDYLSIDSMIRLTLLFKRAERDRKRSDDKKTPIPYYLVGFMGHFIRNKSSENLNSALTYLFELDEESFDAIYQYFKQLTNLYKKKYPAEYNTMIKRPIDTTLLGEQIETLETINDSRAVGNFIKYLGGFNSV